MSPPQHAEAGTAPIVVVISLDGLAPESVTPYTPRLITADPADVHASDDVVMIYAEAGAGYVAELRRRFGDQCPKPLVVARRLDEADVIAAFDHGATGYLVSSDMSRLCLVDLTRRTAEGECCLSPEAATVLVRQMSSAPATAVAAAHPGELTPREQQMMNLLVVGNSIAEIADRLKLTRKTVRNNLSCIYQKLHVRGQTEAILRWLGHQVPRGGTANRSGTAAARPFAKDHYVVT
jgi:DNA-binding NarL/FixJ family response regulator